MRKIVFALVISWMILLSIGCPLLSLDDLENPADPDAESYQGYMVIDNPDQIDLYVSNGAFLSDPILIVSDVEGAQSYQIQVADDELFENVVYESSFATNVLQPELPKTHHRRYWRVRVSRDDEWGAWSRIGSFFYLHPQTLYFDAQGGSNPASSTKAVAEGNAYGELPTVSHPSKVFAGWWSEPEGNGFQIAADTLVPTDIGHVAYAKWDIGYYTISFDSRDENIPSPNEMIVIKGEEYGTLPLPTRTGYTFEGWWTEPDGAGLEVTETTMVSLSSDQTLYAKWNAMDFTVTFNRQGGSIPNPLSKSVTYGQKYGKLPAITRSGYSFGGWWTGQFGSGSKITADSTVSIIFDQVLYADWNHPIIHHDYFSTDTRNDYSVSYNSNSGGEVSYSVGALGLLIYGWNGIQVFHNQKVFFPTYTEIVFKVTEFEINTYFTLHWTEFGNDSPGWKNLKRMNSFEVKIYEKTLKIEILQSEISNMNSDGAVVLSSQYPIRNLLKDTWYSVELYRDGLDIDILLDGSTICTVQIPEEFLELDMNLAFGIDSFNGYDVYVNEICYGYSY